MCSKVVNGVAMVWDCGFSEPHVIGWRCEVCGQEAGGTIRYFGRDGDPIESHRARNMIAIGGSTQYFDRSGNTVLPKGW